jgi:outer membrane PBP1 activator LpoA protein
MPVARPGAAVSPGYGAPIPTPSRPNLAMPQATPGMGEASPIAPSGARVAILAPLSGPNAERGQALVRAAQLALDVPGAPALDVLDTNGTPEGAAAAAQTAISGGAGLILGPLTNSETAAAAGPANAAGVGMLAFTTDATQSRPGVWVLGLTPAQQVRRLITASQAQGKSRFAALLPPTEFGAAMGAALTQAVAGAGAGSPEIRTVEAGMSSANAAVRDLSGYAGRRGPIEAQRKAALARHDADGRKEAAELSRRGIPPPPFDALLLADTGDRLSTIASLLPYYDVDSPAVRILGPALWANPAALGGADLSGAWYAAPDPATRGGFDQQYNAKFGVPAPGLADLAYDAASIARVVAQGGGFSAASLTRAEGFAGVNGVLALQPDGTVRRGLAVFQIQRGGAQMVEPAPETIGAPGI